MSSFAESIEVRAIFIPVEVFLSMMLACREGRAFCPSAGHCHSHLPTLGSAEHGQQPSAVPQWPHPPVVGSFRLPEVTAVETPVQDRRKLGRDSSDEQT
jgi:hypothetical protein